MKKRLAVNYLLSYCRKGICVPRWRLVIAIVSFVLMGLLLGQIMPAGFVSGSGMVTDNISIDADNSGLVYREVPGGTSDGELYGDLRTSAGTGNWTYSASGSDLYSCFQTDNYWKNMTRRILSFDLSSTDIEVSEDIISADVYLQWSAKSNTYEEGQAWSWSFYTMSGAFEFGSGVVASDFQKAIPSTETRVSSEIALYTEYGTGEWIEFPLFDSFFDTIYDEETQILSVGFCEATFDSTGANPVWEDFKDVRVTIDNDPEPYIRVSYLETTPERELVVDSNAATDNDTTGFEVADNITWESPRAGYADEGLYFKVNGESGAVISLELQDEYGVVWGSVDNSIRIDGNYDYNPDLPDSWYGWVRLLETNHNLISDWGYQMPKPDKDQAGNTVSAVNTEYPQYEFAFIRYLTYENDAFVLHWKTNIQSDEHGDHNLKIWTNTDNLTPIFDNNFEWLNDNYFNANDNNSSLNHWRYMIFVPDVEGSGFETYDGMIYDLDTNYTNSVAGYIHAVVLDTTDNSILADSHSCYWYLPTEKDGIITRLDSAQVGKGGELIVYVQVGQACQVRDTLPALNLKMIDEDDNVVCQTDQSFVEDALNEYVWTAPTVSGQYVVRFTFSGVDTWDYIHDIPFSVGPSRELTGAASIIDSLEQWIVNVGMDNPVGYWVILLIGMVLLFLVAYKSPLLRVVLPLVFLGLMLIWGKIDTWLIVLLALGAGLTLWGIFRRKAHGGGGGEGGDG